MDTIQQWQKRGWLVAVVLLPLTAAGCQVGPTYQPPDLTSVTTQPWRAQSLEPESTRVSSQAGPVAQWWLQFGDEELARLIAEMASQNLTLAEARQRIVAAQAIRGKTSAEQLPRLDATGNMASARTGREAVNFAGPPPGQEVEVYSAGLSAAWELDLWGRVERLKNAADADIEIAVEDYRDAAVSLAADIATAYIDLRAVQARIVLLDSNIELQRKTLTLARNELEAGSGTRMKVVIAQRQLSQTLALRPALLDAASRSENRISILLGRRPGDDVVRPGEVPQMPRILGLGLPAELIERRADIRRVLASYRAAVERIGAAEAEKYPTVTLSGTLNVQSTDVAKLFGGQAFTYNLGPSLRVPLFDGGRINANVSERVARAQERRIAVERTLLEAIGEVENAAVGIVRSEDRQRELADAVTAASSAVTLADELYQAGLTDFLQVIDTQRQLVDLEDRSIVARRDALAQAIQLYRALGGGWQEMPLDEQNTSAPDKTHVKGNAAAMETKP